MEIELNPEEIEAFKAVSVIALQTLFELLGVRFVIENGIVIAIEV